MVKRNKWINGDVAVKERPKIDLTPSKEYKGLRLDRTYDIVFTGKCNSMLTRAELTRRAVGNMHKVRKNVTTFTNLVVYNPEETRYQGNTTRKINEARSQGIKLVSYEDFVPYLNKQCDWRNGKVNVPFRP